MIQNNSQNDVTGVEAIPIWLEDSLKTAQAFTQFATLSPEPPPETFHQRSKQAAQAAFLIAQLRDEKRLSSFVPLALGELLEGLARIAGLSLTPLLVWLNAKEINALNPDAVGAAVRVAKLIGCSMRETMAHLRLGFANAQGAAPVPLLLARYRATDVSQSPLESCETLLTRIETKYEPPSLRQLRQLESLVHAEFAQASTPVNTKDVRS
ncbi:MAG: hypothetical protein HOP19_03910 [Acidobacteria bacterium]|nr:hypothetical protein [Acidobacteriota bacterium]